MSNSTIRKEIGLVKSQFWYENLYHYKCVYSRNIWCLSAIVISNSLNVVLFHILWSFYNLCCMVLHAQASETYSLVLLTLTSFLALGKVLQGKPILHSSSSLLFVLVRGFLTQSQSDCQERLSCEIGSDVALLNRISIFTWWSSVFSLMMSL